MDKVFAILAALALTACSMIDMAPATAEADTEGRQFAPPAAGQAAIYVYGRSGAKIAITANRLMLGDVLRKYWLRADLPAGRYDLRCVGVSRELSATNLLVDLAPGQIVYVSVGTEWNGTCGMEVQQPDVAQPAILAGKRVRELN